MMNTYIKYMPAYYWMRVDNGVACKSCSLGKMLSWLLSFERLILPEIRFEIFFLRYLEAVGSNCARFLWTTKLYFPFEKYFCVCFTIEFYQIFFLFFCFKTSKWNWNVGNLCMLSLQWFACICFTVSQTVSVQARVTKSQRRVSRKVIVHQKPQRE